VFFIRLAVNAAPSGGGTPSGTPTWAYVVVGVLGAALTAIGIVYTVKRVNSGKIDTSEAAQLWAESNAMRKELRDETVALRSQNLENTKRIEDLQVKFVTAQEEAAECQRNATILQRQINELQTRLASMPPSRQPRKAVKKTAAKKTTRKRAGGR
jgi:uncharacterized protein HemX